MQICTYKNLLHISFFSHFIQPLISTIANEAEGIFSRLWCGTIWFKEIIITYARTQTYFILTTIDYLSAALSY